MRLDVGYAIPLAGGDVVVGAGVVVVVVVVVVVGAGRLPAGSSSFAHFWPREALVSFRESLVERTS